MDAEAALSKLIARRTITPAGCWEWTGYRNEYNYGLITLRGNKKWFTHRLSYTIHKGPIEKGKFVCHSCDNSLCMNPAHLWVGDQRQNLHDAKAKKRIAVYKRTHCKRGHSFAEHGITQSGKTGRVCYMCELGKNRIKTGWPADLAYSQPPGKTGYRPPEAGPVVIKPPKKAPGELATHCRRGHEFSPENTYWYPGKTRRACRACMYAYHRANAPNPAYFSGTPSGEQT